MRSGAAQVASPCSGGPGWKHCPRSCSQPASEQTKGPAVLTEQCPGTHGQTLLLVVTVPGHAPSRELEAVCSDKDSGAKLKQHGDGPRCSEISTMRPVTRILPDMIIKGMAQSGSVPEGHAVLGAVDAERKGCQVQRARSVVLALPHPHAVHVRLLPSLSAPDTPQTRAFKGMVLCWRGKYWQVCSHELDTFPRTHERSYF
eukprot:225608-Rhodomonas_salina.1